MQRIAIIGTIGASPEQRTTPRGHETWGVRVAVSTRRSDDGEDRSSWYYASAYGYMARQIAELRVGDRVYIDGTLSVRRYNNASGAPSLGLYIDVSHVKRLDPPRGGQREPAAPGEPAPSRPQPASAPAAARSSDDDVPF